MRLAWIGLVATAALAVASTAQSAPADVARQRAQAARVTITRDDWGIAHVHGKTDADAVFGMAFTQGEDDFNRVEANYLTALGRTAEAEGEAAIWADLRQKLYVDPTVLKASYAASPAWLRTLMDAWADGLNFYLATHPSVTPRVIKHFEPWMALSFTEGSIGGDIERINLKDLEAFYGGKSRVELDPPFTFVEPTGSNGIAIAPKLTKDGHALLLINPHTSFFFRSELQMQSDEGLNAYGAVTWGQFFVYQGFNAHAGWMHTSSSVDSVDEFAETLERKNGRILYRYGAELRPVTTSTIVVPYRTASGAMAERRFTVYRTHHGPIVRADGPKWIAFAMMHRPIEALQQSFLRTKARDYASFAKVAQLSANSSNDTLFADDKGAVAYLRPQFIPRRDDRFDYRKPVDGADPATDWRGVTPPAGTPQVVSPPNGWVYNSNNWPYSAAGAYSPKPSAFPKYMDTAGETTRGVHAVRLLETARGLSRESLLKLAFDPALPAFERILPSLIAAYDAAPATEPMKARVAPQIAMLRAWDRKWGADSVETSLAIYWAEALFARAAPAARADGVDLNGHGLPVFDYVANRIPADLKLAALAEASDRLTADFGTWRTPWGEINRFQRLTADIDPVFRDDAPSTAVPFTGSQWGSLAAFGARRYPGTKRWYGNRGNSFVAVVEFGPRVRALAVSAGGESGHRGDPHFNDQAERYASGNFREVYFYPDQLTGHTERRYRPGE